MTDYQRYFGETQNLVRESVRAFVAREISPNVERWEEAGELPMEDTIIWNNRWCSRSEWNDHSKWSLQQ